VQNCWRGKKEVGRTKINQKLAAAAGKYRNLDTTAPLGREKAAGGPIHHRETKEKTCTISRVTPQMENPEINKKRVDRHKSKRNSLLPKRETEHASARPVQATEDIKKTKTYAKPTKEVKRSLREEI